ncbi:MAG: peptidoglycan bridge formation glycyltransferase FemA/FemB family protein [bacterium]
MNIKELNSDYEKQINKLAGNNLLQSFAWGEFQVSAGQNIFRLGVEDEGELVAAILIIKIGLPLGRSYYYIPRGPMNFSKDIWQLFLQELKKRGRKDKTIFVRFEPFIESKKLPDCFESDNQIVRKSKRHTQPPVTWITDLKLSEEDLLSGMHSKTRYNIRLAEKKGVTIEKTIEEKNITDFYRLLEKTTKRGEFAGHPRSYYSKELTELAKTKNAVLYLAEYENKYIAGILVSFFGDTVTYLHGASDYEHRNIMAPFLLQWQALKEAKASGFTTYDWHGITLEENHAWAGITRFKQGFPGRAYEFTGTYDLILQPLWYQAYRNLQKN